MLLSFPVGSAINGAEILHVTHTRQTYHASWSAKYGQMPHALPVVSHHTKTFDADSPELHVSSLYAAVTYRAGKSGAE